MTESKDVVIKMKLCASDVDEIINKSKEGLSVSDIMKHLHEKQKNDRFMFIHNFLQNRMHIVISDKEVFMKLYKSDQEIWDEHYDNQNDKTCDTNCMNTVYEFFDLNSKYIERLKDGRIKGASFIKCEYDFCPICN